MTAKETNDTLKASAALINEMLASADDKLAEYEDCRLQAAIELATVKKHLGSQKALQEWCKDNVSKSWSTLRQLVPHGEKEMKRKGSGKASLDKARKANAKANAKARAKKTTNASQPQSKKETPSEINSPKSNGFAQAWALFLAMDTKTRLAFMAQAQKTLPAPDKQAA